MGAQTSFEGDFEARPLRCPDAKMGLAPAERLGPDRIAALDCFFRHLTPSIWVRGAAVRDSLFAVGISKLRRRRSGTMVGRSLNLHEGAACAVIAMPCCSDAAQPA